MRVLSEDVGFGISVAASHEWAGKLLKRKRRGALFRALFLRHLHALLQPSGGFRANTQVDLVPGWRLGRSVFFLLWGAWPSVAQPACQRECRSRPLRQVQLHIPSWKAGSQGLLGQHPGTPLHPTPQSQALPPSFSGDRSLQLRLPHFLLLPMNAYQLGD